MKNIVYDDKSTEWIRCEIARLRCELDKSYESISEEIGISNVTLSRFLNKKIIPSDRLLGRMERWIKQNSK